MLRLRISSQNLSKQPLAAKPIDPRAMRMDAQTYRDLEIFEATTGASVYDISKAAGPFFAISSDQLFSVGGAGTATDTTFGSIQSGPGDKIDFGAAGVLTGSASSSSNGPPSPLGLGATVRSTGLLFCLGGTSDGSNAVSTTFRALN